MVAGRDAPDIHLDPVDKSLSRRHLALAIEKGVVRIKDLKSMNGTFLKVENGVRIEDGDEFRIGHARFVVALTGAGVAPAPPAPTPPVVARPQPSPSPAQPVVQPAPTPSPASPAPTPAKPVSPAGEPCIMIRSLNRTIPVKKGQTVCDALEAAGIPIDTDCRAGQCGIDPIQILEGGEHLNACGEGEADSIERICDLEPGPYRLSCMAKPRGPVVIEVVKR
jgi:ferredoxin